MMSLGVINGMFCFLRGRVIRDGEEEAMVSVTGCLVCYHDYVKGAEKKPRISRHLNSIV